MSIFSSFFRGCVPTRLQHRQQRIFPRSTSPAAAHHRDETNRQNQIRSHGDSGKQMRQRKPKRSRPWKSETYDLCRKKMFIHRGLGQRKHSNCRNVQDSVWACAFAKRNDTGDAQKHERFHVTEHFPQVRAKRWYSSPEANKRRLRSDIAQRKKAESAQWLAPSQGQRPER